MTPLEANPETAQEEWAFTANDIANIIERRADVDCNREGGSAWLNNAAQIAQEIYLTVTEGRSAPNPSRPTTQDLARVETFVLSRLIAFANAVEGQSRSHRMVLACEHATDAVRAILDLLPTGEGWRPLWAMHVRGPDDVYAAPDYNTALAWCDEANKLAAGSDVLFSAVPALWPWSPAKHALDVVSSTADWSAPSIAGEGR